MRNEKDEKDGLFFSNVRQKFDDDVDLIACIDQLNTLYSLVFYSRFVVSRYVFFLPTMNN